MEAKEDFSFRPIIDGGSNPVTKSPPLWTLSSEAPKSIDRHEKEGRGYVNVDCSSEKITNGAHRKSDSCAVDCRRTSEIVINSDEEEEDEKMDMLWEDFNEELLKNLSSRFGSERLPELEYLESEEAKEDGGGGRALLSGRMASVVVIMKVVKKLLFLHNFRRKLRARTW